MKIYTGQGDEGYTTRPGGKRVRKSDPVISAVGAIDELTAHLGLCAACCEDRHADLREWLTRLQGELLTAGAMLAAAGTGKQAAGALAEAHVQSLEDRINRLSAELPAQRRFLVPGGCELAARLHVARAVCRRAERDIAAAVEPEPRVPRILLPYCNRLSDLLHLMARMANRISGADDTDWRPEA